MDRNDRALTAFAMLGHATFHTYELVVPILVVVWLDTFSTSAALLGVVVGASYACTGIGALPSGVLADRFSARRLVVASMAGMGAGFLLVSLASGLATLAVGLLVWGVAASVYHPAGLSLISRGAKERGTAFAYHGVAGNVGVATGPLLGAVLLAFFGWRTVAALLVVPAVVGVVLALRLEFDETAAVDPDAPVTDGGGDADADAAGGLRGFAADSRLLFAGGFLLVFLVGNLYGLYYRGAFTFLPEVLAGLALFDPVSVAGRAFAPSQYVYSGLLVLGGAGQFLGGKLVDRFPAERVLVANFAVLAAVALAFVPAANAGLGPLLVVSGMLGFFVFLEAPVNQEVISRHVPAELRGLSFGWTYIAVFGVGALGSAVAGIVLTRWSPAVLFGILAAFAGLAGLVGLYLHRRTD
jgi:MFS family permease